MASSLQIMSHVILTGPPGVGKTTLIHKVCEALRKSGVPIQGFYTEEVREHGKRSGFDVVTTDGLRGPLARVNGESWPGKNEPRVGQYTVLIRPFEQTALPSLRTPTCGGKPPIFVVDEIGKMELFSNSFKQAVDVLLSDSKITCLCTIPETKGRPIPFVEEIRNRHDTKLIVVSRDNRNNADLLRDIVKILTESNSKAAPK